MESKKGIENFRLKLIRCDADKDRLSVNFLKECVQDKMNTRSQAIYIENEITRGLGAGCICEANEFLAIDNGSKKHHIRLYDEKRKRIHPNDYITFQLKDTDKKCIKRVKGLYISKVKELLTEKEMVQYERKKLMKYYMLEDVDDSIAVLSVFY